MDICVFTTGPMQPRVFTATSFMQAGGRSPVTKIYGGNLPFAITETQLRELFAKHGTVQSLVTRSRDRSLPRLRFRRDAAR
jgi:hypothetical protein